MILVINAGSSSLKLAVLDPRTGERAISAKVERIGEATPAMIIADREQPCDAPTHDAALRCALPMVLEGQAIDGVVHRVVHGGAEFGHPVRIGDEVCAKIQELAPLAPLHNPANLAGIRAALQIVPHVPHIAVFDTAFHHTLPRRARTYALNQELAEAHGIRRYGFHGPSHEYVASRAAEWLDSDVQELRVITCHLGSGASVCAVEYGRSVETSMGYTPLEGLVMGTRCGDLDPGVLISLQRELGMSVDEVDELLNKKSGLSGMSGAGNDLRDIEERAAAGDDACRLAIHVFCHRLRKYVGAYAAAMGGVDAIVFTGGIGENSALVRHRVCQRLDFLGARLDEDKNRDARIGDDSPIADLATRASRVALLAVRTDEEWQMAMKASALIGGRDTVNEELTIPVAVSARHIHLTQETVEALFGKGHTLTEYKPLSQPGQFACEERVNLIGPKRNIENVRVLGPTRSKDQVEISATDEFALGLDAPVRASGHTENTPGITLEGPAGRLTLKEGVICAWRHIHMTPADAEAFGVSDKDVVDVEVATEDRTLTYGDVLVRVSEKYALEMHIDTDEANAAGIQRGGTGALIASNGGAALRRRRITARR
jgi:acetate kinase